MMCDAIQLNQPIHSLLQVTLILPLFVMYKKFFPTKTNSKLLHLDMAALCLSLYLLVACIPVTSHVQCDIRCSLAQVARDEQS